jgi:hypothetical protein
MPEWTFVPADVGDAGGTFEAVWRCSFAVALWMTTGTWLPIPVTNVSQEDDDMVSSMSHF